MKEYWVNVYENGVSLGIKRKTRPIYNFTFINPCYRLHVREFETREAKELYLKLKYGSVGKVYSANDWMNS